LKYTLGERIRRLFEDPFERMREAGAVSGLRVADVGAGKGFFTVAAAQLVGESGLIFAVEPDPDRIEVIRRRCDEARFTNVRFLQKKAEEMNQIAADSLDLVFSMYALHHFESLERGLSEIRRILKPGGRFYVRDIMKGRIFRHGSKRRDLEVLANSGFANFELLGLGRILKARLKKQS
jgi:ubiquinone/menaquinone biosynthesis C-methylase UbiE